MSVALIVGAGPGISGAFASRLADRGYTVVLASRNAEKLEQLAKSVRAKAFYPVDVSSPAEVSALFNSVERDHGNPDVVLFNAGARVRGAIISLDVDAVGNALQVTAMGAFSVAQEAAKRMIPRKKGALFFTGASASVKGFPESSSFAMGKFAVRGLAQSLARELSPLNIHVAHFIIDGGVRPAGSESTFSADNIAQSYMSILDQPPGAWTWEIELRSMNEKF